MNIQDLIFESLMNQMIYNYHPSSIINHEDVIRAIDSHPLFSAISVDWDMKPYKQVKNFTKAKALSNQYKDYTFTSDALRLIELFNSYYLNEFPSQKKIEKKYPFLLSMIRQLYTLPKEEREKFEAKEWKQLKPESNLYHTTNAFEIFEMNQSGTPYGPAWFTIDRVYPPEKVEDFHPYRGAMRVIKYKWLPWNEKDFTVEYPFIDSYKEYFPRILDARKIKYIPSSIIEQDLMDKGVEITLPEKDLQQDILMTYGRNYRPFVVQYLESLGFDGIITKGDEIAIFKPERWLTFDSVEQGDMLYSGLIESLKSKNKQMIPSISAKYNIDEKTLETLFNKNREMLWSK